jgi:hypothetical protein
MKAQSARIRVFARHRLDDVFVPSPAREQGGKERQ